MNYLYYMPSDITEAHTAGNRVVAHVCIGSGNWSGGPSEVIARKWPQTKDAYRQWYRLRLRNDFRLGAVQFVNAPGTESSRVIRVANMIARPDARRPIQFRALRRCLTAVGRKAHQIGASVHLPRMNEDEVDCWQDLVLIVCQTLCAARIPVYIHDRVHDRETRHDQPPWVKVATNANRTTPLPYQPFYRGR